MNKTVFLKNFMEEIWNNKKADQIEKYLSLFYTIHLDTADPWEGQTIDHEVFKERLNYSFNSFPDINFDIQSSIEEEHHVAVTWILIGTNLGNIGDLPPTNKTIKTTGMTIYHFKDNKISGHSQVFDRFTVFKQLGF